MPKLLENDQKMFNNLVRCYRENIDLANLARFYEDHKRADWHLKEVERCSRDLDEILVKYESPEIVTEVINGTTVTGTREYVDWERKFLVERTENVNVVCVVRSSR